MIRLHRLKKSVCLILASAMMSVPAYAQTENAKATLASHGGMISTGVLVAQMDRAEAQARVEEFVGRADVQKMLVDRGVQPEEVRARLASLSEHELRQLAGQVEAARAGGEIVGLLVVVLLVVLIVFLIKKM